MDNLSWSRWVMKTEISKITKNNKLIIFFISIDLPIIPYLPIEGGTSDVSGIWVEANKQNTVSDNRIVTPITISSPLSGGSVNYPAKTSVSARSSPLRTFREEERLRLSDRNSILMTQINVYTINPVVMGFQT